ncbi:hypothetical protein [Pseudomonas sp. PS02290]|uniref:hypothetical protein n=1 Tax=Pseudomonas sp. PS02290 TaxID=2991430 RepID=UPI00249CB731|nr:hypothetical protein [Pseudomonas sp. PS02290]
MGETEGSWGYSIGPSNAMKLQIADIVINHALCDDPLLEIFISLSGMEQKIASPVVKVLNLKSGALANVISSLSAQLSTRLDPQIASRLPDVISDYRKLSTLRNEVAHGQWMPSPEGSDHAMLQSLLRKNDDGSKFERRFSASQLKEIAVGLAITLSALHVILAILTSAIPSFAIAEAYRQYDEVILRVKRSLLALPEPLAEEQP